MFLDRSCMNSQQHLAVIAGRSRSRYALHTAKKPAESEASSAFGGVVIKQLMAHECDTF